MPKPLPRDPTGSRFGRRVRESLWNCRELWTTPPPVGEREFRTRGGPGSVPGLPGGRFPPRGAPG
ncbi:hypothetical protein GS506_15180 [Rhodococcus hoagii]|nr:hypothetical protein [Prescottella equi]